MTSNSLFVESVIGLRRAVRRVWSASSVFEVLTTVSESAAEIFTEAELVGVYQRLRPGTWTYPVAFENGRLSNRVADLHARLRDGLSPVQIDESMLSVALTAPGDVGTWRELLPCTSIKHHMDSALKAEGFADADCLVSVVNSGDGVEVMLFAAYLHRRRVFSDRDRMMLGALADVASIGTRGN